MKLGFNSNVRVEKAVYHVQTEDHGSANPYIDTVVVLEGRVLHRRRTSYRDLIEGRAADETALRARVEEQHQYVLRALRDKSLPLEGQPESKAGPLEISLCNARAWLAGGHASLEIEVCHQSSGEPITGAEVEVFVEGVEGEPQRLLTKTDVRGRSLLEFALPEIAHPETAALVIQARTEDGQNQLRYRIKPAAPAPTAGQS